MEKMDPEKLQDDLDLKEVETSTTTKQNEWADTSMEIMARENFKLLQELVNKAKDCCAVHRPIYGAAIRIHILHI